MEQTLLNQLLSQSQWFYRQILFVICMYHPFVKLISILLQANDLPCLERFMLVCSRANHKWASESCPLIFMFQGLRCFPKVCFTRNEVASEYFVVIISGGDAVWSASEAERCFFSIMLICLSNKFLVSKTLLIYWIFIGGYWSGDTSSQGLHLTCAYNYFCHDK